MFEPTRYDEFLLGSIAHRWVSFMSWQRNWEAEQLLAHDCGFLGVDLHPHSTLYLPCESFKPCHSWSHAKVFAAENEVSLHAELLERGDDAAVYRIYFRFQFAKISKVHFSRLAPDSTFCLDLPKFELPLQNVVFLWEL